MNFKGAATLEFPTPVGPGTEAQDLQPARWDLRRTVAFRPLTGLTLL